MAVKLPGAGRFGGIARKVVIDNITFDSKAEASRYQELKLLQHDGVISDLKIHPRIPIVIGGVPVKSPSVRTPNGRPVVYVADFSYKERGRLIIEDVKMSSGYRTEIYKLKRALLFTMGIIIRETT